MSGWFELTRLGVRSVDNEEFLILSGAVDDGRELDEDRCRASAPSSTVMRLSVSRKP